MAYKYPLHKCRRILKQGSYLYQKKREQLSETDRTSFANDLEKLDQAVLNKNRAEADQYARTVASFIKVHFPKKFFDHTKEIVFALVFAIVVAFLIRQFWFELYEVPTGSMRPTVKELDRLVVSKTTFGINLPFRNGLMFHEPDYVKRGGIIVFTVKDMDVADPDTRYFYLFPGKKRYIKRCIAKSGDTIYFYGGRIYGVDRDGIPITELSDENFLKQNGLEKIDHVPYINIDGKSILSVPLGRGIYGSAQLKQMNLPVGKLTLQKEGEIQGLFFNGEEWAKDEPAKLKEPHLSPVSYSDLWGMGNYAMARLLTRQELDKLYGIKTIDEGLLYLELRHTPNLTYPKPTLRPDSSGKIQPSITPSVTFIPMQQEHLTTIQKAMITSRFNVQNERAFHYQGGKNSSYYNEYDPLFHGVQNGKYEFYYGQGYKVHFGGIVSKLPTNNPLYSDSPENVQKLFNLGFAFNKFFSPMAPNQPFEPQRFAYYRDGDLYLMGAPILKQNDPTLVKFAEEERAKERGAIDKLLAEMS